ncbi:unnamed protein product [Linum tenue]|uniref:Uncharacterized protein n=1 Tax=Linum tenue TaxID=586396 RepID=A0AAV0KXR2_9ROSI|nr:unnamed protein product [Linum tenue]CAI0426304.1 unnamed protein product [Linum tenue]
MQFQWNNSQVIGKSGSTELLGFFVQQSHRSNSITRGSIECTLHPQFFPQRFHWSDSSSIRQHLTAGVTGSLG